MKEIKTMIDEAIKDMSKLDAAEFLAELGEYCLSFAEGINEEIAFENRRK